MPSSENGLKRGLVVVVTTVIFCMLLPNFGNAADERSDWHVVADNETELVASMTRGFRQAGASVLFSAIGFDVTRDGDFDNSLEAKKNKIDKWQRAIADELGDQDFDEISDEELRDGVGLTREAMRQKMVDGQPFGVRDNARARFGRQFFMLVNKSPAACVANPGVIMVIVMAYYPLPDVSSDYGNVSAMIMGLGGCNENNTQARREINRLKRVIDVAVRDSVGR